MDMPLADIERLLEQDHHLAKVGAVSVMDFQARNRKTSAERRGRSSTCISGEYLVRKAVGWMLREAGTGDERRLPAFLDQHAASMPQVITRYAIEKLDPAVRRRYLVR